MKYASKSASYKKVLGQVPEDYYSSGVNSNLLQKIWHTRKWLSLNQNLANKKGRLLDIGCADGTTTSQIKKLRPDLSVIGIDLYKPAINFANKNNTNIKFIVADAHKLPFKKNHFDVVTTIEVLEHMHDSNQVIGEIHRTLKPDGTLIIVQDTDSLLFKAVWWFWTKSKGSVWKNSHISCMRPNELIRLVKKNGFKIKSTKLVNLGMEIVIEAKKNTVGR